MAVIVIGRSTSEASCLDTGLPPPPEYPYGVVSSFPANGLFLVPHIWLHDGVPLQLAIDDALSAKFLTTVYRPTTTVVPGITFVAAEEGYCVRPCSSCNSPCADWRLVISEPDLQAPTRPSVEVRTLLVKDPAGDGPFSCGDVDKLELTIVSGDDTTEQKEITFGAFVAPTAAEVDTTTDLAITFGYDRVSDTARTSTVVLGESVG